MIIKGSARGHSAADTLSLARHLVAQENEEVELLQLRGVVSPSLPAALEEMRLVTLGTRARRGLYHASISLDRDEAPGMGNARWLQAADELEQRLGMEEHARAVVRHIKRGREHIHVVWCRVHPETLKLARDSQNYRKHEECSRALEARWGLRHVVGAHTRIRGTPRPVAIGTHGDWQAQERTGIAVNDVADALRDAWSKTSTGRAFAAAIEREGFRLARGRRGIVLVDDAGTPHSIPRRLQLKAAVVRARLTDIDEAKLPSVEQLKPKRRNTMHTKNPPKAAFAAANAQPRRGRRPSDRSPLTPDYWRQLGFDVDEVGEALLVRLPGGTTLHDSGDRMTLMRDGEPTADEIAVLVAAGKARGWEAIRFFGGSPEFQRRARIEALRQGYRLDQISLECEDGAPLPMAATPMPEHIRRQLASPAEPPAVSPPQSDPAAPQEGFRR